MVEIKLGKNWLNDFIFHLSFLKKLSPNHTNPPISICEFSKPYQLFFLEFESFIKCKIWIVKKSLNNFISHLSWLRKLSLTHTHPLISICKFLKPYELLFFEFGSFVNGWKQIGKNWLSNFICYLSFLKKLSPNHTHPPISISTISKCQNHISYYFLSFESFIKVGQKLTQ